jgi:hypothetical protein
MTSDIGPLYAPISLGELVDKVSILEIKLSRVRDPTRRDHVRREHQLLSELMGKQGMGSEAEVYRQLHRVNQGLWELEDRIRAKEAEQAFDAEFIEIARGIYRLNDRRHALKRAIDLEHGSQLIGEKEYAAVF